MLAKESEANLVKCVCSVELEGPAPPAGSADAAAAAELARAGAVLAVFQARTAREVDLVPGGAPMLVRPPWRLLPPVEADGGSGGGVGGLPVLLCQAVTQG